MCLLSQHLSGIQGLDQSVQFCPLSISCDHSVGACLEGMDALSVQEVVLDDLDDHGMYPSV